MSNIKKSNVLLQDITKIYNFVQNKINEKLNSQNKNQYEILEIEFLKNKFISKNKIIQNLFRYNTQKEINIDKNTWHIKDTFNKRSCRTCNSKDSSVCIDESSPCNKIPMHRSIQTLLKTVKTRNASITPLFPRNEEMPPSRHYSQEMKPFCQTILTIAMFPNLTMLMNTKKVLLKLTTLIGHLVLLL